MDSHSIIPPSSAHIWGAPNGCTGWVMMSQQFPEQDDSPESAEGNAAHTIGETLIENGARAINLSFKDFEFKHDKAMTLYTEDMFDSAKMYADDVIEVARSTAVFGGDHFGTEAALIMPRIHALNYGTSDQYIFNDKTGDLYIWDFKHGFESVEVFENWQLIDYCNGIAEKLDLFTRAEYITVHFRIVQPRAIHRDGPIREWKVKLIDLRAQFNTLETNAAIALSDNAECVSGAHCRHCSARHACESALTAGMRFYEVASKPVPLELSHDAIGLQLQIIKRAIKSLEFLESGYEEQIKNLIRTGANIPGWKAEQGVGREKWNVPIAEVLSMGLLMNHDLKKPDDAITPVQARKLGIDDNVIIAYSTKPNTGIKIVPDNGNKAKRIFNHVN